MNSCKEVVKTDREEKGIGTAKRIETRHDLQFHGDKLPLARPQHNNNLHGSFASVLSIDMIWYGAEVEIIMSEPLESLVLITVVEALDKESHGTRSAEEEIVRWRLMIKLQLSSQVGLLLPPSWPAECTGGARDGGYWKANVKGEHFAYSLQLGGLLNELLPSGRRNNMLFCLSNVHAPWFNWEGNK